MDKRKRKEDSGESSDLNHSLYEKGRTFYNAGDYRKATAAFKEALEYWPEDGEAWLALGNCYDASKKPKRAEKCFRQSLAHETEKFRDKALFNLGNSLYDQCLFEEAIECYDKISNNADVYAPAMTNKNKARQKIGTEQGEI